MYLMHVSPRKSSKWEPPVGEELITADRLMLKRGAHGISKKDESGGEDSAHVERSGPGLLEGNEAAT